MLAPWKKSHDKLRQCIENQRHPFDEEGPSSHIWMWELDYKEGWVPNNWCFVVLEKTLGSPLDCKEIKPVSLKGDQPWIFIGRTDVEAETPILWPPDVNSWLIGKDPDSGRDWRQEEKGMTEDEMAGWHHWLDGHDFECTPGVSDGQGGLACCNSWGHKESDTTGWLNWSVQSWVFTKAETPILWPPDVKNWLIGKYPDSGKDWGQ